ncbi:MAG TPA: hypothetical protein VE869_16305, partial [Gemmatimonas sp.]|nr:hypothetical protein [Gemmatimonas sp.]
LRVATRRASDGSDGATGVAVVIEGGKEWARADEWEDALRRASVGVSGGVPMGVHGVWWKSDDAIAAAKVTSRDGARERVRASTSERAHVDDLAPEGSEAFDALAFAQVNRGVAEQLRQFVLEQVVSFAPQRVIDGYAGTGLLSEALAAAGVAVTAIESDPMATASAAQRLTGFAGVQVITDRVERALPGQLPADVVVLNPPRRGVDPGVVETLAGAAVRGVRAIIYVSCDPATLSRDLARLPAWRICALRCYDMFPQTAHVETVCVLTPEES